MELTFTREDVPKITRPGGSGREAEPWETHLAPLKDTPDESFRVWTYEKRTSAVSRMSSVRDRLSKQVPHENWGLAVRVIPGEEKLPEAEQHFGVYISYNGVYTAEQIVENKRKHDERSERVRKARAKTASAPVSDGEGDATPSQLTPKEKVQQARANKQGAKAS
jgi:hypothetical protein